MKKKTMVYLGLLFCIVAMDIFYFRVSEGDMGQDLMQLLLIHIMLVCQILRDIFSKRGSIQLPEELQEQEDYVLAKNRVGFGAKIGIVGGLMIIIPVVLLLVLKELHGTWARIAVFAFLGGVPAALIGIILAVMGNGYIAKAEAKYRMDTSAEPEPESRISKICNGISVIASVALLAVIFLD